MESKDGPISKSGEQQTERLAINFYKKFGYVNGNIIALMISQESK